MKVINTPPKRRTFSALSAGAAGLLLFALTAQAHPYATCLTNSAGVVSFRLNETNASVLVIGNAGTLTNDLGVLPYGLTVTNLTASGMTGGVFKVQVTKAGSGAPEQINDPNMLSHFEYPLGVAVNKRPGSPYFGRIYVGNARGPNTTGTGRLCQDGIYILNADITDLGGNNVTNATYYNALTAGINMTAGGTSMPWRLRVGEDDDNLYICDWSDAAGNLWQADPNVSDGSGKNIFMLPVGSMASPLDASMNHGSVAEVVVTGKLSDGTLKVYTVDEDYETIPGFKSELNSLWQYNIGSGPLPWSTYPDLKLATPAISFVGQTMGLDRATNGYFYLLDNRSSGNENMLQVVDPATQSVLYQSRDESLTLGFSFDYLSNGVSVAVSPDMKFCAVGRNNGRVVVMPMVDGIPSLAKRIEFYSGMSSSCRQICFDAADNLYLVSNSTERMRVFSLGLTTSATTGSDGTFSMTSPSTTVSVANLDTDTLSEANSSQLATFNLVRANDDFAKPLPVNVITTRGTATRGSDYNLLTNGVVATGQIIIPAGASSTPVSIVVSNDTIPELTETVIVDVAGGAYNAEEPSSITVTVVDNDSEMVDISLVQGSMFEGLFTDYARFRATRRGDTNAAVTANLSYAGTAAATRYNRPATVTFNPGDVNVDFDITPVNDSLLQGNQTIVGTIATGAGYLVGTNSTSATATIVDDEVLPENVLWSENFDNDNSAGWTLRFGSVNEVDDYRYAFNYDYSSGFSPVTFATMPVLPPAPHSVGGTTKGMYLTVNKDESSALGAAGINLYPTGKSFKGNYALRFDMYLMVGNAASTTEYALFGINHSGNATNWFRNSGGGITNGTYDGVFFGVEADAAALGDYVPYSRGAAGALNPLALTAGVNASTLTGIFKSPPFSGAGAPGTSELVTNGWCQVEVDKVGPIIKLRINNTQIMSFSNTTSYAEGNIMLGYCDAYDSIMAGNSCVIYDNVRVVGLDAPLIVPPPTFSGSGGSSTNVVVKFTFGVDDATSAFKLQKATTINGAFSDWANTTITKTGPGQYTATGTGARPTTSTEGYFRIRYVP